MNTPMIKSGIKLLIRSIRLLFLAFPDRQAMAIRWTQTKICFKAIGKGLAGVPSGS